jgi:hypothetical protein
MVANMDPVVMVSAMVVTKSVASGITGSTSYIRKLDLGPPFQVIAVDLRCNSIHASSNMVNLRPHDQRPSGLERTFLSSLPSPLFSTYSHPFPPSAVTNYRNSAAKAFGKDKVKPSTERYEAGTEYMDECYQLWGKSWEDGAPTWQVELEMAYDPSKIHRIDYKGQHHQLFAYGPAPQRTPVIFQAGASKSGIDFAGKHAEAIYTDYSIVPMLKEYVEQVRAAAVRHGRAPTDVKIFAAMCLILGRTLEEA